MRSTKTTAQRMTRHKAAAVVAGLALFATACGGSGGGSGQTSDEQTAILESASQNESGLTVSADLVSTEMLDVRTGEPTTLSDVVDGDRAVVVWYWAPH